MPKEEMPTINLKSPILNLQEREESAAQLQSRMKENPTPDDDERRLGTYKEFLEPQIRDAILTLLRKGYSTTDSGYDGRRFRTGKQYLGFENGFVDNSILPAIQAAISDKEVTATFDFGERDFLDLTPKHFLTLEEWKIVWDKVAEVFPDRKTQVPYQDKFLGTEGH
jgi:hypothetical protein